MKDNKENEELKKKDKSSSKGCKRKTGGGVRHRGMKALHKKKGIEVM